MRVCNIIQTGKEGQRESNSKLRWHLKDAFNYISEKLYVQFSIEKSAPWDQ